VSTHFDALIIGAGQAGPFLADRFAGAGQKVAIAERRFFGGTCVNTGCTPTKTMVASARVAHQARRAAEFGVSLSGTIGVDMPRVKARKGDPFDRGLRGWHGWRNRIFLRWQ
jgi:pyruvate/2-oxoglutarate dehydrogenase complex dihydrolipoamide dehydrogenase (E3) component